MRGIVTMALALTMLGTQSMAADGPPSHPGAERRYQALVDNSPWFRELRVQKECSSIRDSGLRKNCIDSFGRTPRTLPAGFVAPPPIPGTSRR